MIEDNTEWGIGLRVGYNYGCEDPRSRSQIRPVVAELLFIILPLSVEHNFASSMARFSIERESASDVSIIIP